MNNKIIYLTIDNCPSKNFKEKLDFLIINKLIEQKVKFAIPKK